MEAMGLTLDGDELCLARLRKHRGVVEIVALERVRLSGQEAGQEEETEDAHYREVMGLVQTEQIGGTSSPATLAAVSVAVAEEELDPVSTQERTLHNALFRHADKGLQLGLALEQEDVTFTTIGVSEPLSARKLRRRVRDELGRLEPTIGDHDYDYIPRSEDSILAYSHSGEMELLHRLCRVNDALSDPLRLALIDVNEIALLNLLTRLVPPTRGMSVLVYVGNEFTRMLFLRDGGLHDLSPVIHEGVSAVGNLSQCFGRIVAELDVAGVDTVDAIHVAGAADTQEYRSFFEQQFPGCAVQGLPYGEVLTGDPDLLREAGDFAISISLAWKILDPRAPGQVRTNFLPADLRRGWLWSSLAWHGWALASLCATTVVVAATTAGVLYSQTSTTRSELEMIERQIELVSPAAQAVDVLDRRITAVWEQRALVDSLKPGHLPASDLVRQLTLSSSELNSTWLTDLDLTDNTFSVQGVSLYGNRIHRFAEGRANTEIHSVALTTILGKTLYEYDISGPMPSPAVEPPPAEAVSAEASLGLTADREQTP